MEGMEKVIYCKYYAKMCIKLVSHSIENPYRVFYYCPTPRSDGGHGWMEWVDGKPSSYSPNCKNRYINRRSDCDELEKLLEFTKEQLSLCESKLNLVEMRLQLDTSNLQNKLVNENMSVKCLSKWLRWVFFVRLFFVLLIWFFCGCDS
ncbi:hypothetical protein LIER_02014 [Lithospermum erythrorhizon]|uniref:GRF-type domain-containing protein n=1 Tax=Lithospermum erythrorhizon TaxID=34254 RepID=A0AAV3NN12_LITER